MYMHSACITQDEVITVDSDDDESKPAAAAADSNVSGEDFEEEVPPDSDRDDPEYKPSSDKYGCDNSRVLLTLFYQMK